MEFLLLFACLLSVASSFKGNSILEDAVSVERVDCNAPLDVGTCLGQEEAWYYSSTEGRCIFFVYSGCGGNTNRFVNRVACEEACDKFRCPDLDCPDSCTRTVGSDGCEVCACTKAEASKVCGELAERGYCRALYYKWAWVSEERRCKQFVYGGCGGNENNFDSEEMCLSVCSTV